MFLETLGNHNRILLKPSSGAILAMVFLLTGLWVVHVKGSILDPAEIVVEEVEFHDPAISQKLNEYFAQTKVVGIEGSLSGPEDVDSYELSLRQGWSLELQFEIQPSEDKALTAIAAGADSYVYFVSDHGIWRYGLEEDDEPAELVISSASLAEFLELDPEVQVEISAIAGVPNPDAEETLVIALGGEPSSGGGDILGLDRNDDLIVIATWDDIAGLTGESVVEIASIAADEEERIYVADQASGSVLQIEREPDVKPASYVVSMYTSTSVLYDVIEMYGFEGVETGTMAPTVIAQTETDPFMVNSLIQGTGEYGSTGYDWYYLSQLGPGFGGTGGITSITINQNDPEDIQYDDFYYPSPDELDLNPSALAFDPSYNGFASYYSMFMGTFGPSLGDAFDGQVYAVDVSGDITSFVFSYEDGDGQPVMKGGQEVTGFFDVVDMAFPPTFDGPFGEYLYVLSENIDQNGAAPGGFSSDIWRIDSNRTAELFVENIADGVISLAFGNSEYGNDLFVATFHEGKVFRVDSAGTVELFFDFSSFGDSPAVCDMAFAPPEVPGDPSLAGALVLTMKLDPSTTMVVQLEPDGQTYKILATDLQTGDVSSGDLVFDEAGNLIVTQQTLKNLVRLDYVGQLGYSFNQLQVRPMWEEGQEEPSFVPYVLAHIVGQPVILRLSDSGDAADIVIEADSSVLDVGEVPGDGSKEISFVFDAEGDLFTYIQNAHELRTSPRNEEGEFTQFTTLLTGSEIETSTGLEDVRLPQLAWSANGSLLGIGTNGTAETLSQAFDDVLIRVGNTLDQVYEPLGLVEVRDLTQMRLEVAGPDDEFYEFTIDTDSALEERLELLTQGSYTLSVSSTKPSGGDYEFLIVQDDTVPGKWICDDSTGPRALLNRVGEPLIFAHTGPGQSLLEFEKDPNGWLMELSRLTVTDSNRSTSIFLTNQEDPDNMLLEELVLNGSLGQLVFKGTLNMLRGAESTKGMVKYIDLGTVRDVDAAGYTFPEFRATNLGDAETENHQFLAKKLTNLIVENNVENINILNFESRNVYRVLDIGGIVDTSIFYGSKISECIVRNLENKEMAMQESYLACIRPGGSIDKVQIVQGDLYQTGIYADWCIKQVEFLNGNLDGSTVETLGQKSIVGEVIVRRVDELSDPNESGNILGSRIAADREIKRVHADEEIDDKTIYDEATDDYTTTETTMETNGGTRAQIGTVTCEGDCYASFYSYRIKELLIGFDENKQKIRETDEYSGGNLSGSVTAISKLDTLSATGSIENASIYGYTIENIFAEDGLINTDIRFGRKLTRIMVGYENGRRSRIANYYADVSGTCEGLRLGRLYYTGENTIDLSSDERTVYRVGPVIDDVPED